MNYLVLSEAYGQWVRDEDNNGWVVYDKDGNRLTVFPSHFNEHDVMQAIRLGREFELKAFNVGIEFGKDKARKAAESEVSMLKGQIQNLMRMNEDLSAKLERFIVGENEE